MNPFILSLAFILVALGVSWPLSRWLYRAVEPSESMGRTDKVLNMSLGKASLTGGSWKRYFLHLLGFNAILFVFTWVILSNQHHLPLNPDGQGAVSASLIFNTTVSFVTNTNLQHYSGEATFSYFSQLTLMFLQFTSAATGIAAFVALSRGLSGRKDMGSFARDLARIMALFLFPLATILAVIYILASIPMTLEGAVSVTTLEGSIQTIARGPVAAFLAIKQLGTNGGGFLGPNSTHPFEGAGIVSNFVSLLAIPIIPMACVWVFGRIVGRPRHACIIAAVMTAFIVVKISIATSCESAPTAAFAQLPVADSPNLEGKELRFGATTGPLWSVLTTCTSNGSVGAMHGSLNPLTLLAPFSGMWLNSTFGGVGVGFINFFLFMIIPLAIAGSLAMKPKVAESIGTLSTDTLTFGFVTFAVILFLGALTFLPVALLGPILMGSDGEPIGSHLIAQEFKRAEYFHPRPSAAGYNGQGACGSNLSPNHPKLTERAAEIVAAYSATEASPIPADLVTASGSGLDNDITLAGAVYQIPRVASARAVSPEKIRALIDEVKRPLMGALGGPELVNVFPRLKINHPFQTTS